MRRLLKFNENTAKIQKMFAHYFSSALSLTCTVYLLARVFINIVDSGRVMFSLLAALTEGLARALCGGPEQV